MKNLIIITSFAAFIVFAVSCNSVSPNAKNISDMQNASVEVYYTCTMHPEVHSDKPGNCPKCGMELVKKEVAKSDSTQMQQQSDSMQNK
jgi:hypothetical protein